MFLTYPPTINTIERRKHLSSKIMSATDKALQAIKNISDTSIALNPSQKCVLSNSDSESSSNGSKNSSNSVKKRASKGKVKKASSSAASKEKQVQEDSENTPRRSKRNQRIKDYEELQQKQQKRSKQLSSASTSSSSSERLCPRIKKLNTTQKKGAINSTRSAMLPSVFRL